MRKIYTTLAILVLNISAFSQDKNDSLFTTTIDLASRYVWRGTDFGNSPSIQPGIEFNKCNFTVGAWGAYALDFSGTKEVDFYLAYTIKEKISITLTDYFCEDGISDYKFFDFRKDSTTHLIEPSISWLGTEKLPLTFLVSANIYGADARRLETDSITEKGIQYSAYAEIGYTYRNVDFFMGFNLTNPNEKNGESGYYGNNYGIVNLGLKVNKEIKISDDYSLPVCVSLITNPQAQKIFLTGMICF